jgi:hypothetical protein
MDLVGPKSQELLRSAIAQLQLDPSPTHVLPDQSDIEHARKQLAHELTGNGLGLSETIRHLQEDLKPAFNASSRSPNYGTNNRV